MEENDKALKYALNILNRKDYTEFEMLLKLKGKGFAESAANNVLDFLKDKNFLNDRRYVENFVYFRIRNGYGKKRIEYDLKKKGVDEKLIDKGLKDVDETEFAKKVFESKLNILKDKKNKRLKLFSFLARRGYSHEMINELLNNREGLT